jgi:hypothetical protein
MRTSLRVLAVCSCAASLVPGFARSETQAPETQAPAPAETSVSTSTALPPSTTSDRRTLNGHNFMPAAEAQWPFTITSLTSQLLLGYGKTTANIQIRDQTFSGTAEYAGIGGILAYEYGFMDYFSVRARLTDTIFSGINGKSALAVGTEVQFAFGVGATASVPIGDTLRLGVLFDFFTNPALGLTVATGLQSVANTCSEPSGCHLDLSQIFGTTTVKTLQPAVAASWAPIRQLGLTANVAYQHLSSSGATDQSGDTVVIGGAADWDFATMSSVPIGLQLQASWLVPFSSNGLQHVTDFGGGIFYTARKDVAAGAQFIVRRFAVAPNTAITTSTYLSTIGLRYFW